jgi:hypothetical protein
MGEQTSLESRSHGRANSVMLAPTCETEEGLGRWGFLDFLSEAFVKCLAAKSAVRAVVALALGGCAVKQCDGQPRAPVLLLGVLAPLGAGPTLRAMPMQNASTVAVFPCQIPAPVSGSPSSLPYRTSRGSRLLYFLLYRPKSTATKQGQTTAD